MTWQDSQPKQQSQEDQIRANMDSKQLAIRISSAVRDATMIVTAKIKHQKMTDEEIKEDWLKWKKWLYEQGQASPF